MVSLFGALPTQQFLSDDVNFKAKLSRLLNLSIIMLMLHLYSMI